MTAWPTRHRRMAGFTLIELAVVLLILGLLIAAFLGPLTAQLESRARAETRAAMSQAVEALYGFAVIQRRLPCADTDGDGLEQPGAPRCAPGTESGMLPWRTLGLEPGDAWRRYLGYRVDPAFTQPKIPGSPCSDAGDDFDLCELGDLIVYTRGDNPATGFVEGKTQLVLVSSAAAVVVSYGANGSGGVRIDDGTGVPAPPPGHLDERENVDGDAEFVSRIYSEGAAGCDDNDEATVFCEYDDMVRWVAPALLIDRMVRAGRLP